MRRTIILSAGILLGLCLQGCVAPVRVSDPGPLTGSTETPVVDADSPVGEAGAYRLRPLDPVFIRFSGIQEQQALELVIDENGEISLLHIAEPIMAAGLTTSALEKKIERLYVDGQIYKNVSVNVTMTAKVYYMQGEVNAPGQYELTSGTTLLQAIAGARGPTAFANMKKVTLTRHGKVYTFNVKKLEKDPSSDIKIEAGDVIKVWQQWY
ncbi:MAG TPA: polysaccharide biosynthesis/export family protein [Pontiella sp.]